MTQKAHVLGLAPLGVRGSPSLKVPWPGLFPILVAVARPLALWASGVHSSEGPDCFWLKSAQFDSLQTQSESPWKPRGRRIPPLRTALLQTHCHWLPVTHQRMATVRQLTTIPGPAASSCHHVMPPRASTNGDPHAAECHSTPFGACPCAIMSLTPSANLWELCSGNDVY